ncbi:FAD binding domain-containing protein [Trichlorobacter lovleyi]|jgi:Aerobic-type carbon monoxide dehydrogenase, middle subunit CoxM/CutM homologs|uniref:Molybdopterin dehydrogenase FAD-binding n=1 Tax=Trichlorobacter lovleyi (strain ATCC BAA-1151 / DSM 17278 / SZ) TaxID=398767 RepID=B3E5E2_TRIL1|nr:xanthine dehydrogenase family protein subunit M [Trichlorobacter lovleyi]ACD96129.1 molybdopterin dehydrogenase FAD-binding [Trichlorobacter lovleyi SZ]
MLLFPNTVEELFNLLNQQPDTRIMAGGTDLLVAQRHGSQEHQSIIVLERLAELSMIEELPDNSVSIGAAVTFGSIVRNPLLKERYPLLTQAASTVGGPAIRNMASIGGNIVTASPAADSLPALYLLDARLELRSATGSRIVAIDAFISGPRRTLLQPGELISRIILPPAQQWNIQCFEKVGRRKSLAIAVASLAAMLRLADDGTVLEARFAWGSVGPTVLRCTGAEAVLINKPLSEATLQDAAALVQQAVQPIDDIRATADYRRTVAGNLLFRLVA